MATFPKAAKHGEIREILPDLFLVSGTIKIPVALPLRASRNMTIVREGDQLTLVNSMRLGEAGLKRLEALGTVRHVIRLAGFHGMDDPFYKDRYGAEIWSVDAPYATGFPKDLSAVTSYLDPDHGISASTAPPIANARFIVIESASPREALLLLERDGGVMISGDALQNWHRADEHFNVVARIAMKGMGFIKPHNVGPGWLRFAKPDRAEVKRLLDNDFEHLMPAHGAPVIGNAKKHYTPVLSAL